MSLQVIKKIQLKRVLQILLKIDQQLNGTIQCEFCISECGWMIDAGISQGVFQ